MELNSPGLQFFIYVMPQLAVLGAVWAAVFLHELGHLIMARLCGVGVLCVSVGLGPQFYDQTDRHGTRWRFAAFPIAGGIKLLESQFADKTTLQKTSIFFAGPTLNILTGLAICFPVYWSFGAPTLSLLVNELGTALLPIIVLGIISVIVGVFNLMPLPPLDGGHMVFLAIQACNGGPVSDRAKKRISLIGYSLCIILTSVEVVSFIFF